MTSSRVAIWALLATVVLLGQTPAPKIVFVCEHGAAKSIMAAAEFERMAKEQGLTFEILARGTTPDAEIAAAVKQGLKADGMEVGAAKPVKVSAQDVKGAAKVITFGPDLSALTNGAKVLDWSATPSPSKDYRAARDSIRKDLETLLREWKPEQTKK